MLFRQKNFSFFFGSYYFSFSKRPELTKYLMDLISNNRSPENQLIVDENRRKIKASEETSSELSSHKKGIIFFFCFRFT